MEQTLKGKRISFGMVGATEVNIEQGISGFATKANAVEVRALGDEAVGEGVAAFALPLGPLARCRVGSVDVVIAMRK